MSTASNIGTGAAVAAPVWGARSARLVLPVFFLSGMLMSTLGAVLPAWGYHLRSDYSELGLHFLSLAVGLFLSYPVGRRLGERRQVGSVVSVGAGLGAAALLLLAMASPPAPWGWRASGLFTTGFSAGLLNAAAFRSISRPYEHDRAAMVNLAGAAFGLGCVITALLLWGVFYVYTVSSILVLLALIPAFAAAKYSRAGFDVPVEHLSRSPREVWHEVKSPATIMFTLLLFFQLANEWTVAGWLPVYLVQRIGVSPEHSLLLLAVFWGSLLLGRMLTQAALPRWRHGRFLVASIAAALLGSTILIATNNLLGAWTGTLLLGAGFSAVYPLVVEKIGDRFPGYHPGFFNGLLSLGISGGLLAPWLISYLAQHWGIWMIMVTPLAGTFLVFLLLLLIGLEARLNAQ